MNWSPTQGQSRRNCILVLFPKGVPGGILVKNPPANCGNAGSIPRLGRSPGVGNGNPLQYSFLEKSLGQRSLAGYSPWGLKESDNVE